jgi:hypothetical protein
MSTGASDRLLRTLYGLISRNSAKGALIDFGTPFAFCIQIQTTFRAQVNGTALVITVFIVKREPKANLWVQAHTAQIVKRTNGQALFSEVEIDAILHGIDLTPVGICPYSGFAGQ